MGGGLFGKMTCRDIHLDQTATSIPTSTTFLSTSSPSPSNLGDHSISPPTPREVTPPLDPLSSSLGSSGGGGGGGNGQHGNTPSQGGGGVPQQPRGAARISPAMIPQGMLLMPRDHTATVQQSGGSVGTQGMAPLQQQAVLTHVQREQLSKRPIAISPTRALQMGVKGQGVVVVEGWVGPRVVWAPLARCI